MSVVLKSWAFLGKLGAMKVLFDLPQWPGLRIEGQPEEIARLLHALKQERRLEKPLLAEDKTRGRAESPKIAVRANKTRQDSPAATVGSAKAPANRREMVLEAMAALRDAGEHSPKIKTIIDYCQKHFAGVSVKNLDQVIRDLAHKTSLVESPSRGQYQLSDP